MPKQRRPLLAMSLQEKPVSVSASYVAIWSNGRFRIKHPSLYSLFFDRLDRAYRESHYWIPGRYDFRIGGPAYGVLGVIITAWNPRSVPLSPWKNHLRQHQLIRTLRRAGYSYWRARCGRDDWWEESVLVHDMGMSAAYALAQQFAQQAFVYLDKRRVWLVYTHQQ
ncbi:hypothetical protein B1757_12465 [Acidithiobacillus marinus]|uniref:DUF3293 domain-containing protein n=1 Tax=Acidithiobacillus marinus TaxID=187490 RepID=A0A2I1DJ18_9PROT|nr:DUF3293 domain-containing protein [Acidithiobacillus marinus]PKY09876.1 hypothetical protein B1757_12465 [Acidithiobacillus marinus]